MQRLNILVISAQLPYFPWGGATVRLQNLYQRLSQWHNITWISPIWPGHEQYVEKAKELCKEIIPMPNTWEPEQPNNLLKKQWMRVVGKLGWQRLFVYTFGYVQAPGLYWLPNSHSRQQIIQETLANQQFDLVVCENLGAAELLPNNTEIPSIITIHDVQSTLFKRTRAVYGMSLEDRIFFWPELLKIRRYEKKNYRRYQTAITVSQIDKNTLQKILPNLPIEVIPIGVDTSKFIPNDAQTYAKTLVYVGDYNYPPNVDAVDYFCQQIFPRIRQADSSICLRVVGPNAPSKFAVYPGVEVLGFVENLPSILRDSAIVIVPLRVGTGVRSKIVEALAAGKPIVSTTLGAEGLNVKHGENILLADDPTSFSKHVLQLLNEPQLRVQLGKNARRLAEQEHDWDKLAMQHDALFRRVAQ